MADIVFPGSANSGTLNSGALPTNTDLVIYKGDFVELFITINDAGGVPVDLSSAVAEADLKSDYADRDPKHFECSITGVPGQVRVFLSSTVTANLLPGSYIWDFQITSAGGETRTYLAGDVTVYNEVTV